MIPMEFYIIMKCSKQHQPSLIAIPGIYYDYLFKLLRPWRLVTALLDISVLCEGAQ